MFDELCDDLILHIMSFNNYTSLKAYNYINKYTNKIYNTNKMCLYKNIINERCNYVETSSSYNFQIENKTVSITKNINSTLIRAMYLSELF